MRAPYCETATAAAAAAVRNCLWRSWARLSTVCAAAPALAGGAMDSACCPCKKGRKLEIATDSPDPEAVSVKHPARCRHVLLTLKLWLKVHTEFQHKAIPFASVQFAAGRTTQAVRESSAKHPEFVYQQQLL